MQYVVYAAVFILFLGAVALVAWGTRKGAGKERMMTSLDRLDAYDPNAYRKAELARPASERLLAPAVDRLAGHSAGHHPAWPRQEARAQDRDGRPPVEPRCQRAARAQAHLAGCGPGRPGASRGPPLAARALVHRAGAFRRRVHVLPSRPHHPQFGRQTEGRDSAGPARLPRPADGECGGRPGSRFGYGEDRREAARSASGRDPNNPPSDPDGQGPARGSARARRSLRRR